MIGTIGFSGRSAPAAKNERPATTRVNAHRDEGAGDGIMTVHPGQAQHENLHQRRSEGAVDTVSVESALRAAVAERLGEPRFGLWFGEGVRLGLSGDGSALEVQVPSAFFREWIKNHFADSLAEAGQAVAGRPVRLTFAIHDEAEPPLGDVVEPDGDRFNRQPGPIVTVPVPGNPKTPLTSPGPLPASPDRFSPSRPDFPPSNRT